MTTLESPTSPLHAVVTPHPAWCSPLTCRSGYGYDPREGCALVVHTAVVHKSGRLIVERVQTDIITAATGHLIEREPAYVDVTRNGTDPLQLDAAAELGTALTRAAH